MVCSDCCTSTIHTQCTNHGLASALFAIAMVIEVAPASVLHQSIQCRSAPAPINDQDQLTLPLPIAAFLLLPVVCDAFAATQLW